VYEIRSRIEAVDVISRIIKRLLGRLHPEEFVIDARNYAVALEALRSLSVASLRPGALALTVQFLDPPRNGSPAPVRHLSVELVAAGNPQASPDRP